MRIAFALLIGVHGLIHLIGAAKAFKWAEVTVLRADISPLGGPHWLTAAIVLSGAAIGFALNTEWWWWLGLPGVMLSQANLLANMELGVHADAAAGRRTTDGVRAPSPLLLQHAWHCLPQLDCPHAFTLTLEDVGCATPVLLHSLPRADKGFLEKE